MLAFFVDENKIRHLEAGPMVVAQLWHCMVEKQFLDIHLRVHICRDRHA